MKGLLLKDFYMMRKYCRSYIFIVALFIAVSFFGNDNLFLNLYPCLLCGMIPVNLLAYDEQSRFTSYCGALPYTKAQIVSGKYITGLLVQSAMLLLMGIAQAVKMVMSGNFVMQEFLVVMLLGFFASALVAPLSLPFMFKFGTEKGRMIYLFMVALACAGGFAFSSLLENTGEAGNIVLGGFLPWLCLICVGIYALSWYLSIVFYSKREI
ncbi:MAG: ABC-2 transporter permease [Clostridia bacterium]|nr:ABC-2 transporter permease [Clostridia bacterium]